MKEMAFGWDLKKADEFTRCGNGNDRGGQLLWALGLGLCQEGSEGIWNVRLKGEPSCLLRCPRQCRRGQLLAGERVTYKATEGG